MLRSLLLFPAAFSVIPALAGPAVRIAPEIGLNISKNNYAYEQLSGAIATVRAGILSDILLPHIRLQTGIYYTTRGGKDYDYDWSYGSNVHIHYLEIPLLLQFGRKVGRGNIFWGFGPGMAMGLNGRLHFDWTYSKSSVPISFEEPTPNRIVYDQAFFKRFDYTLNLNAGFETHFGMLLRGYLNIGLRDISRVGRNTHTFSFGVSAAYLMKLKQKRKPS